MLGLPVAAALLVLLAGCSLVAGHRTGSGTQPPALRVPPVSPPATPAVPPDIASIPDAVPRSEARSRNGNPPFYDVLGHRYTVLGSAAGYVERGVASWYGPGFHGVSTSVGEPYDMYGMTAAHKTLPLPCYARVTNLQNGRSVVVRINDRGPFVANRIIDLSYTAAAKLDMLRAGTAMVEVRVVTPDDPQTQALDARGRESATHTVRAGRRLRRARQCPGAAVALAAWRTDQCLRSCHRRPAVICSGCGSAPWPVLSTSIPWRRALRRWEFPTRDWRTTDKLAHLSPYTIFEDPKRMIRSLLAAALLSIATLVTHAARAAAPIPAPPSVPARAYLLEDYQTSRVLASDHADDRMEPASLTKLMTAYIVFTNCTTAA